MILGNERNDRHEIARKNIPRNELNKHERHREMILGNERNDRHEIARKNIVEGQVKLSYREIQRMCKLNGLGKANATRQVLENRLLTFFHRVDPEKVQAMGLWELVNIKWNLDGDRKPAEDDRAEYGEAEDRKNKFSAYSITSQRDRTWSTADPLTPESSTKE
jgi:hypothetical protein